MVNAAIGWKMLSPARKDLQIELLSCQVRGARGRAATFHTPTH